MYDPQLVFKCFTSAKYWPRVAKVVVAKLLHQKTVLVRADGVALEGGTQNGQGLWCLVSGLDYEEELRVWLDAIQPGDVVLDVGANIGVYSIRASERVGPRGRVIACEPLPTNIARLKRNLLRNGATNVSVIEAAVGDREGLVTLYEGGRQSSASLSQMATGPSHRVKETTIDAIVEDLRLTRVDWVKMDIEGAEPIALAGMRNTLARFKPQVLFENSSSATESIALLQTWGYAIGRYDTNRSWRSTRNGANLFARPSLAAGSYAG